MSGIDEIVHVPEVHAARFVAAIERINQRARRLGARARVAVAETGRERRPVSVTSRVFREGAFHTETADEMRPCVLYRMECPVPAIKLPGWEWAGWIAVRKAEKDSVTGTVDAPVTHADPARPIAQATLDRAFDAKGRMVCEHCNTFRNRRMGFVVRDAAGAERVVGSSCLLDHTGHDPKAVLSCFKAIGALRDEIAAERSDECFRAAVYDWEAHAESERAARRARDAVALPARRIVVAILKVMGRQGFYAWKTEEAVRELLAEGFPASPEMDARAGEILAWDRERRPGLPEDPDAPVSIGAYLGHDPGFRIVEDYDRAGHAPLGRAYADGEVAEVTYLGSEDAGIEVPTAYGTKQVDRLRHVFRDAVGSRLHWETASGALDGALVVGGSLRIRFKVKDARVRRFRMVSRITNVRAA